MNGRVKYLIDTNIIIDQLRGFKSIVDYLQHSEDSKDFVIFISVITELEIYSGKSMDNSDHQKVADSLLGSMLKIPIDSETAKYAGKIKRKYKSNFPDALIAATAIANNCTLVTRNAKHFQGISKLKLHKL